MGLIDCMDPFARDGELGEEMVFAQLEVGVIMVQGNGALIGKEYLPKDKSGLSKKEGQLPFGEIEGAFWQRD